MKLKDFNSISEANEYSTVRARMISPDMMVSFLTAHNLINTVLNSATDGAKGLQLALQFGSEFNVIINHPASIETIVDQMIIDNVLTQDFKDFCVAYANPVTYPFANTTLAQFNASKGLYMAKPIAFTQGKDIAITLNTDLSERVSATVWRTEIGFNAENAGRNVYLQTAGKYRIDMTGKKPGNYEIRIPLLDADFSVELI